VITLEPNATYSGNFVLPNIGAANDYITIRSAAPDAALPGAGIRMTPAYAALLPKIKIAEQHVRAGDGDCCEPLAADVPRVPGQQGWLRLGAGDASQTQLSQVPYAFVIDRVYVHGDNSPPRRT